MLTKKNLHFLPQTLRKEVLKHILEPMPRGRGRLVYRTPLNHLDKAIVSTGQTRSFHIAFFGYYPYATIIKRAIALRAACHHVHLTFVGCCIREDADILRWFDQAYEVQDYQELFDIVSSMKLHALQVTAPPFWPALLILAAATQTRVVLDLVDTALFHSDGKDNLMKEMEAFLLKGAWSLVHKLPSKGLERLVETYDVTVPAYQLHSLPWKGAFEPIWNDKDTKIPHFVYCGGVMPRKIALSIGYGHHIFDPLILGTKGTGIQLDFFVNKNAREMFWEEHEAYIAMAGQNPLFSFNKGVPFHLLPQIISTAHFGLLYDNTSRSSMQTDAFRYNMSSKIFSYLEAGLPLASYREFAYICEWIEEYGIGVIYDAKRPDQLAEIAAKTDYEQLQRNVEVFREQHELTASNHDLQLQAFGLVETLDS